MYLFRRIRSVRQSLAFSLGLAAITGSMMSCSSSTMLNSSPIGAKVYIDGEMRGTTPFTYSDTHIYGTTTYVRISLEGYQDAFGTFRRTEKFNILPFLGCFTSPWCFGYDDQHTWSLTHKTSSKPASTPSTSTLEERLKSLMKMRDEGTISQEEYDQLREQAIQTLTK